MGEGLFGPLSDILADHKLLIMQLPSWKRLQGESSVAHPVSTGLLTEICNSIFTLKDEKSALDVKPMSWKGSFFFVFPVQSGVSTHDTSVRRSS